MSTPPIIIAAEKRTVKSERRNTDILISLFSGSDLEFGERRNLQTVLMAKAYKRTDHYTITSHIPQNARSAPKLSDPFAGLLVSTFRKPQSGFFANPMDGDFRRHDGPWGTQPLTLGGDQPGGDKVAFRKMISIMMIEHSKRLRGMNFC